MTCYFRNIHHIFDKIGIKVTAENKKEIDKVIHGIVGKDYKNCSTTWREVKKRIAEDEKSFVSELRKNVA